MAIHPTAIVDRRAELDPSAEVGAYAIIEGDVQIGAETRIAPHVLIGTGTRIGQRCRIHSFAAVGDLPQDLKFDGSRTYVSIGDETVIREHASVQRGSTPESTTVVGRRCYIMSTGHVGHNCTLGDDVVLVNGALLAGHVTVESRATLGGNAAVHQFARIGELAMVGGLTRIIRDVPPFMIAGPYGVVGPNSVGMRRAGFSPAERQEIRECYRVLYRSQRLFRDAVECVAEQVRTEPGRRLVAFLRGPSKRGFQGSPRRARGASVEDEHE
jgi:UDP-N-acetylglucosamine acyltransferase